MASDDAMMDGDDAMMDGGVASDIVNFTLEDLTVSAGTAITWTNQDSAGHTSTATLASSLSWDSGRLRTGETFSFTLTEPGTYGYLCTIHPSMTGTITVTQ